MAVNEQTRKDTDRARSRLNPQFQSRFDSPTPFMSEREAASGLTGTTSGREDSFYQSPQRSKTPDVELTWDVHTATDDRLPASSEAFAAIVCVNGTPRYASIQGRIGDEVT